MAMMTLWNEQVEFSDVLCKGAIEVATAGDVVVLTPAWMARLSETHFPALRNVPVLRRREAVGVTFAAQWARW